MTHPAPLVSVVIPAFNCARYVSGAIASARAQAASLEIIVVDDGSTDDTGDVVRAFHPAVVLLRQDHSGIAAARNRGVAAATGEFLAFLDADDLFMPRKLEAQIAHLEQDGGPDISMGVVEEFVSADIPIHEQQRLRARGRIAGGSAGAMLLRRPTFDRVGLFRAWRVGEFADWYLRAVEAGLRIGMLPELVLRRRLHGSNVGLRERHARVDFVHIAKSALDRRRNATSTPTS
jgi:glycosyltransferase involved in cell wall biosynthesis